jgi:hypothetical protein
MNTDSDNAILTNTSPKRKQGTVPLMKSSLASASG